MVKDFIINSNTKKIKRSNNIIVLVQDSKALKWTLTIKK